MADEKLRESQPATRQDSIPEGASDWASQFVKHFELSFSDASRSLLPEAPLSDLHDATIRAVLQTLLDSGMDAEAIEESIGRALMERRLGNTEWNSGLNRRRFELIDKEIQETLTPAEKIELAGLTRIMREKLESETNLPFEGGKALHRRLLQMDVRNEPQMIFDYPANRQERRHGPSGYASYESYRPWLRDEFEFRCVYCLKRETWGQVTGDFSSSIISSRNRSIRPIRSTTSILSMLAGVAIPSSGINPLTICSSYCIRRLSQRKPTDQASFARYRNQAFAPAARPEFAANQIVAAHVDADCRPRRTTRSGFVRPACWISGRPSRSEPTAAAAEPKKGKCRTMLLRSTPSRRTANGVLSGPTYNDKPKPWNRSAGSEEVAAIGAVQERL